MGIVERVNQLNQEYKTRDPFKLCSSLNIPIKFAPLGHIRGYFINYKDNLLITLSDNLSEKVAYFVCAHELGHAILHVRFNRIFTECNTSFEPGRFENEADKFAAQLLFGEPPLYQDVSITKWDMAEMLNVAVCNVDARLIELGVYH